MNADKIVVIGVIVYILLFLTAFLVFINTKFTGSDAAGNGMSKGLTFFYGLGILFLIGVVLTIANIFLFSSITHLWVRLVFFIPLVLPLTVFAIVVFLEA